MAIIVVNFLRNPILLLLLRFGVFYEIIINHVFVILARIFFKILSNYFYYTINRQKTDVPKIVR